MKQTKFKGIDKNETQSHKAGYNIGYDDGLVDGKSLATKEGYELGKKEMIDEFNKVINNMQWTDEFNDFYKDTMGGEDVGYELMRFILDKLKIELQKQRSELK